MFLAQKNQDSRVCLLSPTCHLPPLYKSPSSFPSVLTLRSKWAMRLEWRYWTPSKICLRNCVASSSVRDSFSARKSNSSPPDTSSRIRITSVLFSKMSCRVMMLLCWISRRMLTSRSISSRLTPRRLDDSRRFLINLAAYSTPVLFSLHLRTMANCPLQRGKIREMSTQCSPTSYCDGKKKKMFLKQKALHLCLSS